MNSMAFCSLWGINRCSYQVRSSRLSGNQDSTTIFYAETKATPKNGNMYSRIQCELDSLLGLKIGHTQGKSCELIAHNCSVRCPQRTLGRLR